jgi:hypothetical protein
MAYQLQLLPLLDLPRSVKQTERSGTFVDNIKLPVHRWFRYSAGFSAAWAENLLRDLDLGQSSVTLDPFAGSGTTLLAADACRIPSIGIEAHPFVARVARAKLLWATPVSEFVERGKAVLQQALAERTVNTEYPDLIKRCFSATALGHLDGLRRAWLALADDSAASELVWLALTAILRPTSVAGTAQWQYILPNKTKRTVSEPLDAFQSQVELMRDDMLVLQQRGEGSLAILHHGDARQCPAIPSASVDAVITSPPYANNYDYADATRLEMSFWGQVRSWGDLHESVRQRLIVSSSQHASRERLVLEELLQSDVLAPIRAEITEVCSKLAGERLTHGGKKHYHTMVAAYFVDMAKVWLELRRICKAEAQAFFVIGDSAPYGVYVPVDKWLGELALAASFKEFSFEKLRDRNIKWKNRKHRVPLQEGTLCVRG